jgi:hypothetical protein
MRRGALDLFGKLRERLAVRRRNAFVDGLAPALRAPYPVGLYRRFLQGAIKHRSVQLAAFCAAADSQAASLFVRHDIDTADCMKNLDLLLEVDMELQVEAGVFLRADQEAYTLVDHRDRIERYRRAGFELGLHTSCYAHDDFLGALGEETRVFANALGFAPSSLTVHGLGSYRQDVRERFYERICDSLEEFGFMFADCCPQLRIYDYVFHDSHLDTQRNERFILNDLARGDFPFVVGRSYLLLTHPCYWQHAEARA